jgi:hypothetical protein
MQGDLRPIRSPMIHNEPSDKTIDPAASGSTTPDTSQSNPPANLSARTAEIWRNVIGKVPTAGRQALLQVALEALDRADQAAAIVRSEGLTMRAGKGTGIVRVNPAMAIETKARDQYLKAWKLLGVAVRFTGRV